MEQTVTINTDFIKLESMLKFAAICSSGGEAKILIQDEQVKVNGEICTQRGKKLRKGDFVEIHGNLFRIDN